MPKQKIRTIQIISVLILSSAVMLTTLFCTSRKEIVIGFVASLSGMDYMLGVEGRNAAMLFVDELNASGGIGGRKIKLEIRDIASDDSRVPLVTQELVDAGAVAIIGFYSSSSALAAIPVLQKALVPAISPTSTSAALSGKDDIFFRTIMTSAQDPVVLARQIKAAGQSRVLFIAAAYNKPYYETYLTVIASGVNIAGPVYYNTLKEIDYNKIRTLARKPGYDAVMIVASPLDTGTIAQKLSLAGLSKPLYLSGWAGNNDVITYGGSAVEGAILVHQVDINQTKDSPLAISYRKVFGIDASYSAIETWDSMMLLTEVLRTANGKTGRLYQYLRNIREFTGSSGKIFMDSFGDARRPLYLKRIKNGAFIVTAKVD